MTLIWENLPRALDDTQTISEAIGEAIADHNSGATGEPLYATDTGEVYIHNGTKFVPIITNRTPSSATDTGIKGQIAWDSSYIYVCVATDVWKRTALSSW